MPNLNDILPKKPTEWTEGGDNSYTLRLGKKLEIKLDVLKLTDTLYLMSAEETGLTLESGLAELGDLFGEHVDLESVLPPHMRGLANLGIEHTGILYDSAKSGLEAVTEISVTLAYEGAPWKLIPNVVELAGPKLTLVADARSNASVGESFGVHRITLADEIKIGDGAKLDAVVSLPISGGAGLSFAAALTEERQGSLKLSHIFDHVLPFKIPDKGLGALEIEEILIDGDLATKTFSFQIDVKDHWAIFRELALESLSLQLTHSEEGVTGSFAGALTLGKTAPARFELKAELPDQDTGFIFTGALVKQDSHGALLRTYVRDAAGKLTVDATQANKRTWPEVKEQARTLLGLVLADSDRADMPLLATDENGLVFDAANHMPQLLVVVEVIEENKQVLQTIGQTVSCRESGLDPASLTLADIVPALPPLADPSHSYRIRSRRCGPLALPLSLKDFAEDVLGLFSIKGEHIPAPLADYIINDISLGFETKSEDLKLSFGGSLPIDGKVVDATLLLDLRKQPSGGHDAHFSGTLFLEQGNDKDGKPKSPLAFDITVDKNPLATTLLAEFATEKGVEITLADMLRMAGWTGTPPGEGVSFTLKQAALARHSTADARGVLFNLDIDAGLDLSAMHLPGLRLGGGAPAPLKLAFQLSAAKGTIKKSDVSDFNTLLPPGVKPLPALAADITDDVVLATNLQCGPKSWHIDLDLKAKKAGTPIAPAPPGGAPAAASRSAAAPAAMTVGLPASTAADVKWVNLQRHFGPVHLDKVGFAAKSGPEGELITGVLCGGLSIGPLTLDFIDLSVTSPLTKPRPSFGLDGLGLAFHSGGIDISGALMRSEERVDGHTVSRFDGEVIVQAESFTLAALGSFANPGGGPSLFVYGALLAPLGGPVFFVVEGLAAGFGLHRKLVMPTIDAVASFPLVAVAIGSDASADPDQMLGKLKEYVPIDPGEDFFSIGVKFNSFKIVDSFALLNVQFGHQLEIDILGLSDLKMPPDAPAGTPLLAEAQLAIEATILPEEGSIAARAVLTSKSYILSPDCHLTGGFAAAAWLKGPHAGDFVYTLGGYHPHYKVPAHYPQDVPRLGMSWQLSSSLSMKGGYYYGLTGHCCMAGGSINATFHSGIVSAWFNCGADFLLVFKPYHYDASLYVELGAEATIHLLFCTAHPHFNAGADLHLWGPPMTGHADVHVRVLGVKVHFDVDFGGGGGGMKPIPWQEFKTSFLHMPDPTKGPLTIMLEDGLLREVAEGADGKGKRWIANGRDLCFSAMSTIPSSTVGHNDSAKPFSIKPVGVVAATQGPTFEVALKRDGVPVSDADLQRFFASQIVTQSMPAALWGEPVLTADKCLVAPELNEPALVPSLKAGIRLRAKEPTSSVTHSIDRDKLQFDTQEGGRCKWNAVPATRPQPIAWSEATAILTSASPTRDAVLADLGLATAIRDLGEPCSAGWLAAPQKIA